MYFSVHFGFCYVIWNLLNIHKNCFYLPLLVINNNDVIDYDPTQKNINLSSLFINDLYSALILYLVSIRKNSFVAANENHQNNTITNILKLQGKFLNLLLKNKNSYIHKKLNFVMLYNTIT